MKKLFVLVLVLAISTMATAASVTLKVADNDAQDSYNPSDTITIELIGDFYVGFLGISNLYDSSSGTASSPDLHALFTLTDDPGDPINSGGELIRAVAGAISGASIEDGVPIGEVIWTFEYHVPDVEYSTIITFTANGFEAADAWYMDTTTTMPALEIHVVPEPMTIALLGLGGLFLRRRK